MSARDISTYENSYEDRDLIEELARRKAELEFEVLRARHRVAANSVWSSTMAFSLSLIALLLSLGLAVWPYLHLNRLNIPAVISYVCAFGVLCFSYFAYSTYQTLMMTLEYNRSVRVSAEDGHHLVEKGNILLHQALQEPSVVKRPHRELPIEG
jgi:hypothetical protein